MEKYDVVWNTRSKDSSGSMPLSGKDAGANIWVEKNNLYIYLQQGGWFDENDSMLKWGRLKITSPTHLFSQKFQQILHLHDGYIEIKCKKGNFILWFDREEGSFHLSSNLQEAIHFNLSYETWRYTNRSVPSDSNELFQCKEVYQKPKSNAHFYKDTIIPHTHQLITYHQNKNDKLSFSLLVKEQGLESLKDKLYSPQTNRIFGGKLMLNNMVYTGFEKGKYLDTVTKNYHYTTEEKTQHFSLTVTMHVGIFDSGKSFLQVLNDKAQKSIQEEEKKFAESKAWWNAYQEKSFVHIGSEKTDPLFRVGKNYTLFQYMLASNIDGFWPTKFNGGLVTFDPHPVSEGKGIIDEEFRYTPDYRRWGGSAHTIQNQRLVYWPMLRLGDFHTMKQQFDLMNRALKNLKLRTEYCFGCKGAVYPEQMSAYGLCNNQDMGWNNTTGWPEKEHIRYHFSNSLEMILMILEYKELSGESIEEYMDFILSILQFYNDFYDKNDINGKMIIYPAGCLETYTNVKNPIDSVAGLHAVLKRLVKMDEPYISNETKQFLRNLMQRVPPYSYATDKNGKKYLKYGESDGYITNCENPETYVLFPYKEIGNSPEEREIARNTIKHSIRTKEQNYYYSWHTLGVEYAEVNDVKKATERLIVKMNDGPFRFPAFYGPGHDWAPDFNWGGAGMIQLQEMLFREDEDNLYLLPCWNKDEEVHFKFYAKNGFIIEAKYSHKKLVIKSNKKITKTLITPEFCTYTME